MNRFLRAGVLLTLCLLVVAGLVLTGCSKKTAALQMPDLEFLQRVSGSAVDFNEATLNTMADQGGEAGFKYGLMKTMYPTIFATNKDTVAQDPNVIATQPYWRGDGVHTYYSDLTSADQTAVDGAIFATKLSAEEQAIVVSAVEGFFNRQTADTSAAKALEQNTGYGILYSSVTASAAEAWKTDATAWMAALNAKAAADYSGKTYAQLSLAQKTAVTGAMTIIDPELAFYRAMAQTSLRNSLASATYPDKAEQIATAQYSKAYAALTPLVETPVVDAAVWMQLTADEQTMVNNRVTGLFDLASAQASDPIPLTSNVYYGTLFSFAGQAAADGWAAMVGPTTPGTGAEATAFYTILGGGNPTVGQATFKEGLTHQYYGATATYAGLSAASKAVIDQSDAGMAGLSTVQRLPALPPDQNVLYSKLATNVSATAAAGWATDVANGKNAIGGANLMEWSFYKWLAYESFRNGTAATFYPTQVAEKFAAAKTASYVSAATYAACNAYEKAVVNGMVWSALGTGEQSYVTTRVLSEDGMFGLIQAEMTDAVTLDQSMCYLTLKQSTVTSADNFKTDVEAKTPVNQAFYRWLAKERVKEMASSATLIQQSVGEFYIKITNPNDYDISIDKVNLFCRVAVGSANEQVDAARQLVENVWIPANDEVVLKVMAPTKTMDVITWLVMAGKDTNTARSMAAEAWTKIQADTATWTITADAAVSHGNDVEYQTYTLTIA